jgi:hypothetical protein
VLVVLAPGAYSKCESIDFGICGTGECLDNEAMVLDKRKAQGLERTESRSQACGDDPFAAQR